MTLTTNRISKPTRDVIQRLAHESGVPVELVLAQALEACHRQQFLQVTNAAYAMLKSDTEAWSKLLQERAEWDLTLSDGEDYLDADFKGPCGLG